MHTKVALLFLNSHAVSFKGNGYQLVASNVKNCGHAFEDWYVDPNTVTTDVWSTLQSDNMESTQILHHESCEKPTVLLERFPYRYIQVGTLEINGMPDYRIQKVDSYHGSLP